MKLRSAAAVAGGPKTFGRTKNLNSRRSLGDQTTWETNKFKKQKEDEN